MNSDESFPVSFSGSPIYSRNPTASEKLSVSENIITIYCKLLNSYVESVLEYVSAYPRTVDLSKNNESVSACTYLR